MDEVVIVYCTCPDKKVADSLAQLLLEARLAACINLIDSISAIYRWQGKIERSEEVLMMIKTTSKRYAALQVKLKKHHPYEIPEIIAVPVTHGLPDYLDWVRECST